MLTRDDHLFNLANRRRRVQAFGAGFGTVHNRVAAVKLERIFEEIKAFAGGFIAAVGQPAEGLE